eukprot:CAMPEP_0202726536 /NCGR_PEP_ID=MMETSP1385-20130828/184662_1 /ASSEMBLY_ACC=CAM_ASM_000861 /TAXON_ID=933848 /ORGANISM="Elphidium margaritaceum" /LENGTH=905 /DNA_ID=CAMNT_0049392757 /DNA_START=168 /DNA_END=2885 /DNA_ORIENTATION=-
MNTQSNGSNAGNVNIPQLIIQTQGMDHNARKDATAKLQYLEQSHFAEFILELCRILGSANEATQIRQGAGLLLKNCVGGGRSEEYIARIKERWSSQTPQIRARLKTTILTVLALPDSNARNTAVNVVSNLAQVEGLAEWSTLVPTLLDKCVSKNTQLMHSCLKCIGQIAEDESTHIELQKDSPQILRCIALGMSNKDHSVQCEAMRCLLQIVDLIRPNLAVEEQRNIIFQMVCCGASIGPNIKLREHAFQCIARLIECYYALLQPYMQSIFQITKLTIEKGVETPQCGLDDVTKLAIEVWSTCAEIEYDIVCEHEEYEQQKALSAASSSSSSAIAPPERSNFGFVTKALQLLVPIYLKALLLQNEEIDEDEWTVRKAAACSLELFAGVAKENILSFVLKFVEQNINSPNWRQREAALGAFGYILDGPSPANLVNLTKEILSIILKLMADGHTQVRVTAVWAFGRICELIPDAVGDRNILQPLVAALGDCNSICTKACWCIASLTLYYGQQANTEATCIYADRNAFQLIQELLKRCNRSDVDGTVIIGTHEAMNNIVFYLPHESAAHKQMLASLLTELVNQLLAHAEKLQQSRNNGGGGGDENHMMKLAGVFSSVQVIIDKLGEGCLDSDMANKIMHCCCLLLQRDNDLVYEEALGCITFVARAVGNNFQYFLQMANVQELFLKSIRFGARNEVICRIGAGVIGDVYTACSDWLTTSPSAVQDFTDRIVSELLGLLLDTSLEMALKGHVVDALTDIQIAHGKYANRYAGDILDKCLEIGSLIPPLDADEETMEHFNEIRCSIIDTCRNCVATLAQVKQIDNFQKYLPKIDQFFDAVSKDFKRATVDVLRSCIKLLSESADYCDKNTKRKLQTAAVQSILNRAAAMGQKDAELATQAKIAYSAISNV